VGLWHNIKVRLGMEDEWADGEYYEEDDEYYEDESPDIDEDDDQDYRGASDGGSFSSGASPHAVRRVDRGFDLDRARESGASLRSVPTGAASVTGVAPQVKMHIVEPRGFGEAQTIGDKYKQGIPVILNLTTTNPDLAKRLLDFASGLTYGLDGGLQKVSDRVFMLAPHNVSVSDADRRQLRDTGLFGD